MKNRLIVFFLLFSGIFFTGTVYAGTLSCTVATTCTGGVVIYRMVGTSNSQAQLPSQTSYSQLVCCTGVSSLGTSCSGTYATVLKLSGTSNAHAQQNTYSTYANSACISSSGTVSVGYVAGTSTCATGGYDTTLGSMAAATNSHVGDVNAYTGSGNYKICASAQDAVISVSITTDGSVAYGTLPAGTSKSTIQLTDTQTAKNDGNVAETFQIEGQNTGCPWTLSAAAGTGQYEHEFSTNSGTSWTALTTSPQTLATGVAVNGTQSFDLRLTVPTSTSCYNQQSADITILATQS